MNSSQVPKSVRNHILSSTIDQMYVINALSNALSMLMMGKLARKRSVSSLSYTLVTYIMV